MTSVPFELLSTREPDQVIELPISNTWQKSVHVFDLRSLRALDAARATQRPLLIRGETGTGKSQLARAAAEILEYRFLSKVINANTEIEDLFYKYDTVMRLGETQIIGLNNSKNIEVEAIYEQLNPKHFVVPGPLWLAYDRESALTQRKNLRFSQSVQDEEDKQGTVLLLDEIDKAETDLANSLLEVLANGAFNVDVLDLPVGAKIGKQPLIIITSNDERQLPPAFIRRCVVLELKLPEKKEEFCNLLQLRGEEHLKLLKSMDKSRKEISKKLCKKAATLLWEERENSKRNAPRPGQAEYIDMLNVLSKIEKSEQNSMLDELHEFIYQKHRETQTPYSEKDLDSV